MQSFIFEKTKKKLLPIEVKENIDLSDIKKFIRLMDNLGLKKGFIVTLEQFDEITVEEKKVKVLPAWCIEFIFD